MDFEHLEEDLHQAGWAGILGKRFKKAGREMKRECKNELRKEMRRRMNRKLQQGRGAFHKRISGMRQFETATRLGSVRNSFSLSLSFFPSLFLSLPLSSSPFPLSVSRSFSLLSLVLF